MAVLGTILMLFRRLIWDCFVAFFMACSLLVLWPDYGWFWSCLEGYLWTILCLV